MKKYIYFIVPIVLVVLILNGCQIFGNNTKESSLELTELNYDDIKDKLIRFHVIANSDTYEDQNLKLKVRDKVVEALSEKLDQHDYIEDEYMLEVSSPGAERPLKTKEAVAQSIGAYVNVRTYKAIDNQKEFEGYLTQFENDIMTLEVLVKTRKKTVEIPYDMASKVRLAIKF